MTARQQRPQAERKARKAALKNQSSQAETVSREATAAAPRATAYSAPSRLK